MKICVYAICKNEINYVDNWLNNMSCADYIVVLDTGSTDGTYEKLKSDKRVTKVEQKIISPWRFDAARNESLKLVPNDADVCVCTDFDEEFSNPEWDKIIRDKWIPFTHERAIYKYSWSKDANGNRNNEFIYDKIHSLGYSWRYPVHETLYPTVSATALQTLNLLDDLYLIHNPDTARERDYLPLLKVRAEEFPTEPFSLYLLGREYAYLQDWENAIDVFEKVLNLYKIETVHDIYLGSLLILGECYQVTGDHATALRYFYKCMTFDKLFRDAYIKTAQIYTDDGFYNLSNSVLDDAEKNTAQQFSFIEQSDCWSDLPYSLRAVNNYYLGNLDVAMVNAEKAIELNPNNIQYKNNYELIKSNIVNT